MTIKCQHLFSVLLAATFFMPLPGYAQGLPNTNMGKFVHQPGDNQYQPGAQVTRHGTDGYLDVTGCEDHRDEYRKTHPQAGAGGAGMMMVPAFTLAPPPPKGPDVSIEPIACEEPEPPPGFPPFPNTLDLPVQMGSTATGFGRGSWKNGGDGGGGGGGGGPSGPTGSFEHYNHCEPGAFAKPKNNTGYRDDGGGGGGVDNSSYNPGAGVDGGASGFGGGGGGAPVQPRIVSGPAISAAPNADVVKSGYRVRTAPAPVRADRFDAQVGSGPTGRGAGAAGTPSGGRGPGSEKAPKLDDSQEDAAKGAPEVPAAAGVFQAKSEDLTLPDDEYTSRYFKNGKSGRYVKQMAKRGKSMGRQMLRQTGMPIGF